MRCRPYRGRNERVAGLASTHPGVAGSAGVLADAEIDLDLGRFFDLVAVVFVNGFLGIGLGLDLALGHYRGSEHSHGGGGD